jgi:hypothetical protein
MRTSQQTEVRFSVDTEYLNTLKERLGGVKSSDVVRAALALLDWASEEVEHGRVILSTDQEGKNIHRLVMSELNQIRPLLAGVRD